MTEYEELASGVEMVSFEELDKDPAYLEWLAKIDEEFTNYYDQYCECEFDR